MKIENFFVNGFLHSKFGIDVVSMFKDDKFIDCNAEDADLKNMSKESKDKLDFLHAYITENYVKQLFKNFRLGECGMWSGVDSGSAEWHNDFIDGDPFTSNFLIYLEDNEPYGNSIEVKTAFEEFKIVPKPNEFVWLNQNKKFMHRATHISGPRRLLSFEFFIPEII